MEFEWDTAKNQANIHKHGISFEQAQLIFAGPTLTRVDQRKEYGENRFITMGQLEETAILVVAHTDRMGVTRIISARPANRKERKMYHEAIRKALDS